MSKTYLEIEDVTKLEKAAVYVRDRLLIRILFHLGCRVSEATAITVDDIDLQQRTITIQHLKTRLNLCCPACNARLGKSHIFCPICGAKVEKTVAQSKEHRRMRTLPIDDVTLKKLKDYIRRGGPVSRQGKKYIFGINRHRAWQVIRDCAERAGLPDLVNPETGKRQGVSPHRLRDAFAVHAIKTDDSGDGFRLLQQHLGHVSFNTTARYRKISGREHKKWYQKLWEDTSRD